MATLMIEEFKASIVIEKGPLPRHQKRGKIWLSDVLWSFFVEKLYTNYVLDFQYTLLTSANLEYKHKECFIFSISFELKSNFKASNFILGSISPSVPNFQIMSDLPEGRHASALLPALMPMTVSGFPHSSKQTGIPNYTITNTGDREHYKTA